MERLLFLSKIEKGLLQADAGQTISLHEVQERMARWLTPQAADDRVVELGEGTRVTCGKWN